MRRVRIPVSLTLAIFGALLLPTEATAARAETVATAIGTSAITAELRNRAGGKLKRFYASRQFAPLWVSSGKIGTAAETLVALLATADLDGLKPSSYHTDDLRGALDEARSGDPRALAAAELKLSKTFARYVTDMRRASKPQMVYADARLKPRKLSADIVLTSASLPKSFADYITNIGWMSPHYRQQRALLARAIASNSPPETIRAIRLNLDRARELPSAWTHHIIVDTASGRLYYYQAGRQEGTMRVVVGKPASPTPRLAGMLRYAILNPYWNVPVDLAQKSVAPKILAGRTLASMRMEALSDWSATPQKLEPAAINWPAVASGATELRLRQLPGGDNAMGRVKFMFPNEFGIYLHDTPDKALLKLDDRHLSNGCIRLEDAARLGKWLFGGQAITMPKTPEQIAALPLPVPVYLTYLTTSGTDSGITLATDVYGLDGRVAPTALTSLRP